MHRSKPVKSKIMNIHSVCIENTFSPLQRNPPVISYYFTMLFRKFFPKASMQPPKLFFLSVNFSMKSVRILGKTLIRINLLLETDIDLFQDIRRWRLWSLAYWSPYLSVFSNHRRTPMEILIDWKIKISVYSYLGFNYIELSIKYRFNTFTFSFIFVFEAPIIISHVCTYAVIIWMILSGCFVIL